MSESRHRRENRGVIDGTRTPNVDSEGVNAGRCETEDSLAQWARGGGNPQDQISLPSSIEFVHVEGDAVHRRSKCSCEHL